MTSEPGVQLDRSLINLKVGRIVHSKGKDYRITNVVSFTEIVGSDIKTNKPKILHIEDITQSHLDANNDNLSFDDSEISDKYWQIALDRFVVIKDLIDDSSRSKVDKVAKESGNHSATIYRWIKQYRESNSVLSLIPKKRGQKNKSSRISTKVELIISDVIDNYFLTKQKPTVSKVIELINTRLSKEGIPAPHPNTIRNRINTISPYKRFSSQGEKGIARDKFKPASKEFPGADYPLAYVQIDHTPLDIILVDDEHRQPIGRPYLSLAIDVYSRVITGYYLSLDAPSATSVAMCITSSVLDKNTLLEQFEINSTWDVWGVMNSVHTDNGADFRTEHLQKACLKYGINWEYRPIEGANFGGHIERLLGTLNREIHTMPGTTFSNIQMRGSYDSDEHASLTLYELERWLIGWITKVYHRKQHSSIRMSPMKKWEDGIWGTLSSPGTGLKPKVSDSDTFTIDFLPEFTRSVQRTGVSIDSLKYYADTLRMWIGATEENNRKVKRTFSFKRDPRDISFIWFFDPEIRRYFKIPAAKQEIPPISYWEYRAVQNHLAKTNRDSSNQHEIYEAIHELREQVEESAKTTRTTRRQAQRKKSHEQASGTANSSASDNIQPSSPDDDLWDTPVNAFDDIH